MNILDNKETFNRVKFSSDHRLEFTKELKAKVADYLKHETLSSISTYVALAKFVVLFSMFFFCWYQLSFHLHGSFSTAILMIVFGLAYASIAFTIGHDAGHNSMFKSKKINDLVFYFSYGIIGIPPYIWKLTHNKIHHHYVNIPGHDIDIEKNPVLRLVPTAEFKPYHRFQFLYAPLLYPFFFFNKFFANDFRSFYNIEKRYMKNTKHGKLRVLEHFSIKIAYLFFMIGVPTLYSGRSFSEVLIGYCIIMMSISLGIALTLAGAHLNSKVAFVIPDSELKTPLSKIEHQIVTCIDVNPTSYWWGFFFGGINAHTAHHIFPSLNSIHYPAISKIIETVSKKHGVKYKKMGLLELWWSHYKYLYKLSFKNNLNVGKIKSSKVIAV